MKGHLPTSTTTTPQPQEWTGGVSNNSVHVIFAQTIPYSTAAISSLSREFAFSSLQTFLYFPQLLPPLLSCVSQSDSSSPKCICQVRNDSLP